MEIDLEKARINREKDSPWTKTYRIAAVEAPDEAKLLALVHVGWLGLSADDIYRKTRGNYSEIGVRVRYKGDKGATSNVVKHEVARGFHPET